jgi:hypothetical protein
VTERELAFIRKALGQQGFYIEPRVGGNGGHYWLIRAPTEEIVTVLSQDADELEWDEALIVLRDAGFIIWPPFY